MNSLVDTARARRLGIAQILASGLGFGTLGTFGKMAYAVGFAPGELLCLRFVFSSAILGAGLALFRPSSLKLERRGILDCAALGILGYAVFASCYFEALHGLSASLTALLLYTYPVLVSLGGSILLGERVGPRDLAALPLVIAGTSLLLLADPSAGLSVNRPSMIAFGLASSVFYAAYILGSRKLLLRRDALGSAFYIQLFAALALAPIHLRAPAHTFALVSRGYLPILGLAFLSTALPITLFLIGLQKVESAEASILSASEPVSAVIVAAFALGERPAPLQLVGGAIILVSLVLVSL